MFLSSTFADFAAEREALHADVFPRLRDRARGLGVQFQVIDLRWGVSAEAARLHGTLEICLREVRRCRAAGVRPFVLALAGDRYGWCPPPERIDATELDELCAHLSPVERAVVIDAANGYRLDLNAVPSEFVLAQQPSAAPRIRELLLDAAERAGWRLEDPRRVRLGASATHQELICALNGLEPAGGVTCFVRTIHGLPRDHLAGNLADVVDGAFDAHAHQRAGQLRAWLEARLTGHVVGLETRWSGGSLASDHLPVLCAHVARLLDAAITEAASHDAVETAGAAEQALIAASAGFVGRAAELEQIGAWLEPAAGESRAGRPLTISAPPGSGATALLARAAAMAGAARPADLVVFRSVGSTPSSLDPAALLADICEAIEPGAGEGRPARDLASLRSALHTLLCRGSAGRRVILMVDGVDRLRGVPEGVELLPSRLPPHARAVVTTGSSMAAICLGPLPIVEAGVLVDRWLAVRNRTVQPAQKTALLGAFQASGRPGALRLLVDTAARWHSWDAPGSLPEDPTALVNEIVAAAEFEHGSVLTYWTLALTAVARHGLSELELLELLSTYPDVRRELRARHPYSPASGRLPDAVWLRLLDQLAPLLEWREVAGIVLATLRGPAVRSAVESRIQDRRALHAHLAAGFQPVRPVEATLRAASEWPFHVVRSGNGDDACRLLLDLRFVTRKLALGLAGELITDCVDAAAAGTDGNLTASLVQLAEALRHEAPHLRTSVADLAGIEFSDLVYQQLHNRLAEASGGHRQLTTPDGAAHGLRLLRCPPYPSRVSARTIPLAADERIALGGCVRFTPDGTWLVATTVGGDCVAMDPERGEVLVHYPTPGMARTLDFSPSGADLVAGGFTVEVNRGQRVVSGGFIAVFDLRSGAVVCTLECAPVWQLVVTADAKVIVSELGGGVRVRDLDSLAELQTLDGIDGTGGAALAVDPTRRFLAVGENHDEDRAARISIWDAVDLRKGQAFDGPKYAVTALRFSPDGRMLASGSTHLNNGVVVWTWMCRGSGLDAALLRPGDRATARMLLGMSREDRLNSRIVSILETADSVADLAFMPRTGWLAAVEGSSLAGPVAVNVYNVVGDEPGNVGKLTAGLRLPLSVDVDLNGTRIAVLDAGREVRVWPAEEARNLKAAPPPAVTTNPQATGNLDLLLCRSDDTLHLTDARTGRTERMSWGKPIRAASLDPEGRFVAQVYLAVEQGALFGRQTGEALGALADRTPNVYALHPVQEGAVGEGCTIGFHLPPLREVLAVLPGPAGEAGAVLFRTATGLWLFRHLGGTGGSVRLTSPEGAAPVGALTTPDRGLILVVHRLGADLTIDVLPARSVDHATPLARLHLPGVEVLVAGATGLVGTSRREIVFFPSAGGPAVRRPHPRDILSVATGGGLVAVADTGPTVHVLALPGLTPVAASPMDRPCAAMFLDQSGSRLILVGRSPDVDRPDIMRFDMR